MIYFESDGFGRVQPCKGWRRRFDSVPGHLFSITYGSSDRRLGPNWSQNLNANLAWTRLPSVSFVGDRPSVPNCIANRCILFMPPRTVAAYWKQTARQQKGRSGQQPGGLHYFFV